MYNTPTTTYPVNYWLVPVMIRKVISGNDVVSAACKVFKISRVEIMSKLRTRVITQARYVCMYIMKNQLKMSLTAIGYFFNRDHTTVIHAIQNIENDLTVLAYRQKTIEDIRAVSELLDVTSLLPF